MAGDTSLFETCQVGSGRSRRRRFGVDDRGQNRIAPVVKMETVVGLELTAFSVITLVNHIFDLMLSNHNSVLVKAVMIPILYCLISQLSAVYFCNSQSCLLIGPTISYVLVVQP